MLVPTGTVPSSCPVNGIRRRRGRPSGAGDVHVVHELTGTSTSFLLRRLGQGRTSARSCRSRALGWLRNDVVKIAVSGHVIDLVGHVAVDDLAVRGLDEAERVDAAEGCCGAIRPMFGPSGDLDRATAADGGTSRTSMEARSRTDRRGPVRKDDACSLHRTAGCSDP